MPYNNRGYNNDRRDNYRRDDGGGVPSPWAQGNRGMSGMGGLLPTPSGGGNPLALAGNILASLGNPSAANQLASSLLMQGGNQMGFNQGGGSYGGGYGGGQGQMRSYDDRDRRNRGYGGGGRRSRSRSPVRGGRDGRRNNGPSDNRQGNRGYANKRGRDSSPPRERAPHEIYIGNYPVRFREADVRKLFEEHDVKVNTIRLKHDGLKCFAFAETVSQEEVQKAVKSMESVEISGRRLRVRSAADKDKKTSSAGGASQPKKVRRELNVDDVTRHLAYAFVGFLQRQKDRDEHKDNEDKQAEFTQAVSIINSLYALPEEQTDEDPLKISRNLELIFMQNNRREIKPAEDPAEEDGAEVKEEEMEEEAGDEAAGEEEQEEEVTGEDDTAEEKPSKFKRGDNDNEEEEGGEEAGDGPVDVNLMETVDEVKEEDEEVAEEEEAGTEEAAVEESAEAAEEEEAPEEPKPVAKTPSRGRGRGRGGRGRK